jgi:hypothetical protein
MQGMFSTQMQGRVKHAGRLCRKQHCGATSQREEEGQGKTSLAEQGRDACFSSDLGSI